MKESLLKKEFQEKDLQRARNLISGNYENNTQILVGFENKAVEHKEGDVWTEDGKDWTIEDGVKISYSKLQKARDVIKIPLACPKCGKPLNTRYDRKVYPIHGMCFDCVTKFEDDLRRAGIYDKYEREMMRGNILGFIAELRDSIVELKNHSKIEMLTGEGEVEDWGNISTQMVDNLDEWIQLLDNKI